MTVHYFINNILPIWNRFREDYREYLFSMVGEPVLENTLELKITKYYGHHLKVSQIKRLINLEVTNEDIFELEIEDMIRKMEEGK